VYKRQESRIYDFKKGQELDLINPYTKEEFAGKIVSIKQLPQYAEITSTAPLYDLSESVYELKVMLTSELPETEFYTNATILLKD
jgi:HlyD family secretion protein